MTTQQINGAESLVRTLLACGVDTCFANPGTSEMHFVAALDRVPGMRCVLGLFEGVVTGAADGYARMADKPAATCCTAARAWPTGSPTCTTRAAPASPIVNIVGDQATYHRPLDAPLTADTEGWARPVSVWTRTATSAAIGRRRRRRRGAGARSGAGRHRQPDPAVRRVLGRRRQGRRAAAAVAAPKVSPDVVRAGRARPALRPADAAACWPAAALRRGRWPMPIASPPRPARA